MESMIYNPLEEYEGKYKAMHLVNTQTMFDDLTKRSGVDIEKNRRTVKELNDIKEHLSKLKRKYNLLRFLRVVMCITILLIPVVIMVMTPKIKTLREDIEHADDKREELLTSCYSQMSSLNSLFTDKDCIKLVEKTLPLISFEPFLSSKTEADMVTNYDFVPQGSREESTTDLLSGRYNENPFLFEEKKVHRMGVETYVGTKVICWTETYRTSDGKIQTRTRTQTLTASVTKPKPFFSRHFLLNYCAQGGPDLCFSRDATNLHEKNEKQLERYTKRGAKKLQKKTEEAMRTNDDFVSMSNTDFEVLFDALDRTDEVQFRTLFTPLAQTNMTSLICSKAGYGDDFNFTKVKRTNKIATQHSQGRDVILSATSYPSYSFDIIKANFIEKNTDFFKALYFDFAPLWAIPIYQERPVHSLKPVPECEGRFSTKEHEALSNLIPRELTVHPDTQTDAILKTTFIAAGDGVDKISVHSLSYDIIKRVDHIPRLGGDGRMHLVPVFWDDYIPLSNTSSFSVCHVSMLREETPLAMRSETCIF